MAPLQLHQLLIFIHTILAFVRTWHRAQEHPTNTEYDRLLYQSSLTLSLLLNHFFRPSAGFHVVDDGSPDDPIRIELTNDRKYTLSEDHITQYTVRHLSSSVSASAPGVAPVPLDPRMPRTIPAALFRPHLLAFAVAIAPRQRTHFRENNMLHRFIMQQCQESGILKGPVLVLVAYTIEAYEFEDGVVPRLRKLNLRDTDLLENTCAVAPSSLKGLQEFMDGLLKVNVVGRRGDRWLPGAQRKRKLGERCLGLRLEPERTWKRGTKRSAEEVLPPLVEPLTPPPGPGEEEVESGRGGKRVRRV